MKFTVERNWIDVVGTIWMPAVTAAYTFKLNSQDVHDFGEATRDKVDAWLALHAGDFQSIEDFHAVIGEVELDWKDEESELTFNDCMFGDED